MPESQSEEVHVVHCSCESHVQIPFLINIQEGIRATFTAEVVCLCGFHGWHDKGYSVSVALGPFVMKSENAVATKGYITLLPTLRTDYLLGVSRAHNVCLREGSVFETALLSQVGGDLLL